MRRDDALRAVLAEARRAGAAVFAGNGLLCRAIHALADRPDVFYMYGSMSMSPSIALGYAFHTGRPAVAVEGDGNALMGLSALPLAATASPPFLHVVLDNGVYESTGGQPSASARVDLCRIAAAAGYRSAATATDREVLARLLREARSRHGPSYVRVPVAAGDAPPPRVPLHPREITRRFRAAARTGNRTDDGGEL
jgi:phosphonopyruvate decarboxylase